MRTVELIVPGDIEMRSGGYIYDSQIMRGLQAAGWQTTVHSLEAADASETFASFRDDRVVVIDGLALTDLVDLIRAHTQRLQIVALVHHPVALEGDHSAADAQRLHALECIALAHVTAIICTSQWTAAELRRYGVDAPITVVEPGTREFTAQRVAPVQPPSHERQLLCVASLIPRKAHDILIESLARLENFAWHLHCVGDTTRNAKYAASITQLINEKNLNTCISLHGEVPDDELATFYSRADLFVLASRLEGYGMVLTEALSYGLPIIACDAGAVSDTLADSNAQLVTPNDAGAFHAALNSWFTGEHQRAPTPTTAVRTWSEASAAFANALSEHLRT